jgi:hypothetical protein
MEDALCHFHTLTDVVCLGRAGKEANAKANALRLELLKKRKVDEGITAEAWMPSKKRHEMNSWRYYISHMIDVSDELDADITFPKIHLMSHWVEKMRQYGALQLCSAETHEQSHTMNLKDG